jgi:inosine-uridine nucleoside N-ribohydrolase
VDPEQATENVHNLVERIDPPRMPRIGVAVSPERGAAVFNQSQLHGERGLGNVHWPPVSRQHSITSDKLIVDQVRANPGQVTIVCTGPLTGLAKALQRDPAIAGMLDQIIICGGSVSGVGDVTPCAEFNMHFDPASSRSVFHSATTKSLIPLEISRCLNFGWELVDQLPDRFTSVGAVLHDLIPYLLRTTRQQLGHESVSFQAILPILMLLDSSVMKFEGMAGDVEVTGELTLGATVFDRRDPRSWRDNMEVACHIDVDKALEVFHQSLSACG